MTKDNTTTTQPSLEDVVDQNLEEIIGIIKENYPDIDIFTKLRYTDTATIKKTLEECRKKNPSVKLFYVDIPYYGVVVYRSQTMKDTREVATASVVYSEKLIADNGGVDAINNMNDTEKKLIHRTIQDQTTDFINYEMLKRVVLYPESFKTQVENEDIPYGVIPVLLDVVYESSGFQQVKIEEV